MRYDDMMGLEMYDDGMGAWITAEMLKEHLMAAGSGAVGILATSALVQRVLATPTVEAGEDAAKKNRTWSYYRGLASVAVGILGGRYIYDFNRDAGMGFVGGVAGSALAQLLAGFAGAPETGENAGRPYLTTNLAETQWSPSAYSLSAYDLAALESTVATNAPSWAAGTNNLSALSAPVVREQSLAGTVTTTEDIASYMDAPPPSF